MQVFGQQLKLMEMEHTHVEILNHSKRSPELRLKASASPPSITQERTKNKQNTVTLSSGHFSEMKQRFLKFKKEKYLENSDHYENLADKQAPKFMVIACGDSRVCPSNILGFEPGEAFVVRNVANLVPPHENGPTETNAALEFAVNSLKVENILVIGHSRCGGIRALISMQDDDNSSSFIKSWVMVGKPARLRTKAAASDLSLDQQCRHCEKESINQSLQRLLSYPWIQDKVRSGTLAIHGGYYDFTNCTFEKWTLEYDSSSSAVDGGYCLRNREFWS
ncbi:dehydratase [Lithospermum erythrorhizon]|uniref:Carbonic anhydrase n=1 Tax=Lithospermum erythrorhizon TaxID=34254 RepID=A0AAV3Q7A8_LITER